MNKWNTIRTLLVFSILLIGLAFVTINMSFAMPKEEIVKKWDIGYGDIVYKESEVTSMSINREQIDFTVLLSKEQGHYQFSLPIENRGDYDAVLKSIEKTDLGDYFFQLGDYKYAMSEFVDYQVTYAKNNELNNIKRDTEIKMGDTLLHHSINEMMVTITLKDEKKESIHTHYPNGLELQLSLRTNYQEKE